MPSTRNTTKIQQALLLIGMLLSGISLSALPGSTASPTPGTSIENQATGSYVDETDLSTKTVVSDKVTVVVAEVTGITVTATNTPTAIAGSVANFDFTVTNAGNDPTKFFLPTAPSSITGGTAGTLQVVGYIPAGGSQVTLPTPINITTATDTGALSDPTLGGNTTLGSIPPDAAIIVRVPVTVTAAGGSPVTVTLGNTGGQPSASNTPYVLGANGTGSGDLYTVDNADGAVTDEAAGVPTNGDATNHRQEASATQTVNAIGIDWGSAPNNLSSSAATPGYTAADTNILDGSLTNAYPTLASQNGARHTIDGTTYLGNSVNDETDGQPNFQAGNTDDDGVTFPKSGTTNILLSGQSNTITVNASVAGKLNAWIDWNQDGQWQASEQIATDLSLTAGNNTLPITVANTYSHGVTYARFRFSTQSGLQPTGSAADGEVEDYKVNIVAPSSVACSVGLINGGFESPATQTRLDNLAGGVFSYREAFYPGWSFRSLNPNNPAHPSFPGASAFDQRNAVEIWANGSFGTPAAAGNYFAEVNAYALGNLYQDIQTTPGTVLSWKFSHRGRSGNDTLQLKIGAPGSTVQVAQVTTGNTAWKTYTGTYTIPAGQSITRFEFEAVSTANGNASTGNFIDDVSFGLDCSKPISGTVFEDPNYGGGAGRPLSTPTTSPRDGAKVELYKSDGTYVSNTTTSGGGKYTFNNVDPGDYFVRVVNSTVTSSRPGYVAGLLPVQTFRTNASTGTAVADPDRVGGEKPNEVDAAANSGSQTLATLNTGTNEVQSIAPVTVGASAVTGVDFGYNFDTIVNTNDSGQGALRQFIINSNALTNTGLAQVGQTAGKEVSIFMIADGLSHNGLKAGLTNLLSPQGVAIIRTTTMLPIVTDTKTSIDGTTQTTNVGNTNTLSLSYSGKIGTGLDGVLNTADDAVFSGIAAPEIEIIGTQTGTSALEITGNSFLLQSVSVHGSGFQGVVNQVNGCVRFNGTNDFTVNNSYVGISATSLTKPSSTETCLSHGIGSTVGVTNMTLTNNLVAYNGVSGIITNAPGSYTNLTVTGNESAFNGWNQIDQGDGLSIASATGSTITGNYLHDNQAYGLQDYISSGQTIVNNTIANNGLGSTETSGIMEWGTVNNTIKFNIINNNAGDGIAVARHPSISSQALSNKITISKNSIFDNAHLSINLAQPSGNAAVDYRTGGSPYVTPNDGTTGSTFANNGMDYPIITSSTLSTGTLTVKGFVGKNPAGSATFANATLEFFIAADDGNQNGAVILGDGKSKPHGEGKTYIGSCTADANGLFNCSFANAGTLGLTNANNITATATDPAGNTSEFSASTSSGQVILVKRVTAINGNKVNNPNDPTVPLNTVVDNPATSNDTNPNWPSNFLLGAYNAGKVKPGDEIEYTVYFLNADFGNASNVRICDQITGAQTLSGTTVDLHQGDGTSNFTTVSSLTTTPDTDRATYYPNTNTITGASCNFLSSTTTDKGAIVVDINNDPAWPKITGGSTSGVANSYGFIRFTTKVDATTTNEPNGSNIPD